VTIYTSRARGLGGRLALGVLADRLGVKRVLIAGLLIQAIAAFMFVFASRSASSTPSPRRSASPTAV